MNHTLKTYFPTVIILLAISLLLLLSASWFLKNLAAENVPPLTFIRDGILIVVGLAAGFLGGIIGTGGCSVMLPILHFWLGYPAQIAVGTTLFAVIFTAISGGYGHLIRGNLDKRAVLWLGISGIAGVVIGSWLFTFLAAQSALLGLILGVLFLWPALRMIWEGVRQSGLPPRQGEQINAPAWGLALFGFVVGIATGIAGLGGGYALVPGLIYLFSAPVYLTMGTSLATMIPLALVGGGLKLAGGFVELTTGLLLAAGTVIGAQIGAAVIKRFRPHTLKLIFGLYFLYVSVKFITTFFGIRIW